MSGELDFLPPKPGEKSLDASGVARVADKAFDARVAAALKALDLELVSIEDLA